MYPDSAWGANSQHEWFKGLSVKSSRSIGLGMGTKDLHRPALIRSKPLRPGELVQLWIARHLRHIVGVSQKKIVIANPLPPTKTSTVLH